MLDSMSNRTPAERVIDRRRIKREMRWKDVLDAAGGMSAETLRRVRISGTGSVDRLTLARIERALGFEEGELAELEAREAEGETSTPASAREWDGEIVGPDTPLYDGEVLRWRDDPTARTFELSIRDLRFEAGLAPGSEPADVIDDLRRTLADRVAAVSSDLIRRR